ncbi:MAG TPA: MJ1255/VC2487 family glycosyltransferase [Terriglobales bacterium]|nr:MJ1255/VC2487 family glycosyltransferase [Terriglobales bacterium]
MANILYGVNGEGSGHSSRAREVITHLQTRGHRVHVASFDRGYRNLKDDFDVTEIDGLRLAYVENRVRYRKTVVRNLLHVPQTARKVRDLGRKADGWNLDLVLTDYEPITCHLGHKLRLPIIAIDNQHLLTDAEITYPRECRKEATAAKLVTRLMTPRADAYLVISFFEAPLKKKTTFLFPPILREEVRQVRPSEGDYVLVYVTSQAGDLVDVLRTVRQKFVCYGFNREGTDGNLDFRQPTLDGFLRDLSNCRAIVANAGFSLISEALYLSKPYLAWPVKRQFEQVFNAYYIGEKGYGAYWDDLNKERVESFLFNLDSYREKLAGYPRGDNSALFAKLDQLIAALTS